MPATNAIKYTIGGPEGTPGTAETRTHVIPVRSLPSLEDKVTKTADPAIIGRNMQAGMYPVAEDVNGNIPLSPRPCGAIGKIIRSMLGSYVAPVQIGACIRFRYTGADASQYFEGDGTANTVTSKTGARGAEAVDDAFGTPGYQELGLTGKTGASVTGLSANTDYLVKVKIGSPAAVEYTIHTATTPSDVTYTAMLALLNVQTAAVGVWSIVGGDVRFIATVLGDDSDVAITEGTTDGLLAALSSTPDAAVSGVTGIIDFDDGRYDTVAEIVSLVNALSDYDCQKMTGPDSFDCATGKVITFTATEGKNTWCYVWFASTTSGVYRHTFKYQTATTEHSCYSVQRDGFQDNYLYDGCVIDSFSLSAALQAMAEGDCSILGMKETVGQVANASVLEDVDPMIFSNGSTTLGAKEFTYVRDMSLQMEAGHKKDGFGQGAITRAYQQKGTFKASGKFGLRIDSDVHLFRELAKGATQLALSFYFTGKDIITDVKELFLVELPYCSHDSYEYKDNSGVIDAEFAYTVLYPKGTLYNNPITVHMLTNSATQL
jgi:hypothetical protein